MASAPAATKRKQPTDHLRSQKKPIERKHTVYNDDDAIEAYEAAKIAFGAAEILYTDFPEESEKGQKLITAKAELDEALAALEATMWTIKMRSIGRKRYSALKGEHLPTLEQIAEFQRITGSTGEPEWNPDTFIPVLLAECVYEPDDMTVEEWTTITEDWNDYEVSELFGKAIACNTGRRTDALGKD